MAATNSIHTCAAVAYNEVLLNSKRVAPYAVMIVCSAVAVMGWMKGPAVALGWATNSDFYISRGLKAFSFLLGPPLFSAVIMGDPVIRDFRLDIDPLIFSKPISRAQYLLGKFFGNFFVLVCCMAAFPLTQMLLQAFRRSGMVVQDAKVLPYFKHFFFFVVITHLTLAAIYFTAGTLTRNSKIVYGLAVSFYPIYVSLMLLLVSPLAIRWKIFFDAFLLSSGPSNNGFGNSAAFLNSYVMNYTADMIVNRVLLILGAGLCLAIAYLKFTVTRVGSRRLRPQSRTPNLDTVSTGSGSDLVGDQHAIFLNDFRHPALTRSLSLPVLTVSKFDFRLLRQSQSGIGAIVNKLIGALGVELRLLRAERSLVVLVPLIVFLSILDLAFYPVVPVISYSAVYASGTANALLLFLLGITVFYTGEAIHRDRELKIESVLWSAPIPNSVLLLSKYLATIVLALSLIVVVGSLAIMVQLLRGHTPIDISAYFITYSIILVPGIVFVTAAMLALNVLLRNKYSAYVVAIGIGAGLFYLYNLGYNHWLFNPLLYRLWTYSDLTSGRILAYRLYWLALAVVCLALAHILFERKSR